ncbi:MAG TPA: hypothetical protein VMM76_16210 [Pirellulaceae bacterium]|nr:hypothetical protein [Pirellulaceae bacterium]
MRLAREDTEAHRYTFTRSPEKLTANPYTPPTTTGHEPQPDRTDRNHRGPLLYFALGGLFGAAAAIPLVIAIPISANPNPLGYLLVLLGVPIGGVVYRFRSRPWPIDHTARVRQIRASLATLLLPGAIAVTTGMRAQGAGLTLVGALVSASVVLGIFVAGRRRG